LMALLLLLFIHCGGASLHLHSFPTRRSSDLERGSDETELLADDREDHVRVCFRQVADLGHALSQSTPADLPRADPDRRLDDLEPDRKSTRLNSSHGSISYAVFCLKKKKNNEA